MIKFYFGFDIIIIFLFSSCEPKKQKAKFVFRIVSLLERQTLLLAVIWFSICSKFCGVKLFVKRTYRVTVESRSLLVA